MNARNSTNEPAVEHQLPVAKHCAAISSEIRGDASTSAYIKAAETACSAAPDVAESKLRAEQNDFARLAPGDGRGVAVDNGEANALQGTAD
jgi:hypothetical protein